MAEGKKAYIAVTVHDDEGQPHTFQVGDKVPAWAVEKITHPRVFIKPKQDDGDEEEEDNEPSLTTTHSEIVEPPKVGKGSGGTEWAAYAEQLGIEVPSGSKKDAIIALVEAAKAE